MTAAATAFMIFGIGTQLVLVAFFAARRWVPDRALTYGRIAYSVAGLGLPVGVWLAIDGQSWRLWTGPLILALWAACGATLDVWRKVEWRDPIVPRFFAPFVSLYFVAQMLLWWPLLDVAYGAWTVFTVLFVVNTALNLSGHFGKRSATTTQEALPAEVQER